MKLLKQSKKLRIITALILGMSAGLYMFGNANALYENPIYKVNQKGLTYGSAMDAKSIYEEPDLIRVQSDQGEQGYVYASDLNGQMPKNPKEAEELQNQNKGKERNITVYNSDGVTVSGTFTISKPDFDYITMADGTKIEAHKGK